MLDEIISYREMCDAENVQILQRGMNFRMNPEYSIILMSRRSNAPYRDKIHDDGISIDYEGHDEPKTAFNKNPKTIDQPRYTKNRSLTQNGLFIQAIESYKNDLQSPELVKVYEKVLPGA
ncbi:MAG: hypothetical protein WAX07_09535 [Candidatus Altiarchaeia archaeon]